MWCRILTDVVALTRVLERPPHRLEAVGLQHAHELGVLLGDAQQAGVRFHHCAHRGTAPGSSGVNRRAGITGWGGTRTGTRSGIGTETEGNPTMIHTRRTFYVLRTIGGTCTIRHEYLVGLIAAMGHHLNVSYHIAHGWHTHRYTYAHVYAACSCPYPRHRA